MSKPAVILVGADKGGVGKTMITRTLLDYFEARNVRRDGGDVAAGVGVVSTLDKATNIPPIAAISEAAQSEGERETGERQMPASELQPAFHRGGGRGSLQYDGFHHSLHRIAKSFARSRS